MSLREKTFYGIGWLSISQILRLVLQIILTAILARLLSPADFGLIAMVVVFTGFIQIFSDFGITGALIQKSAVSDELLSSCFWINIIVGLLLTILLVACAPLIAIFYKQPMLITITIALASTLFISSFGIVQTALLTKKLNFKILSGIEISTFTISGCVAVTMAYRGFGVWSMVWQAIVASVISIILLYIFAKWKPKRLFKWTEIKTIISYSLHQAGYSVLYYWSCTLDNLLIGKYLGASPLGFYNLAYNMLLFPLYNISFVLGRVMFPALSSIQHDKNLVRESYIKANRYIAALTFPMMTGIYVLAPQVILILYGAKWTRSIFLLQIFAILGIPQSLAANLGWIYSSQGRADFQFRWGLFYTAVVFISFIIGLRWNVEGVTIAYALTWYALLYPCFAIPFKIIDLKVGYFFNQLKNIFFATVIMGGCTWIIKYLLLSMFHLGNILLSIIIIFLGICFYIIALVLMDREFCNEALALAKTYLISA